MAKSSAANVWLEYTIFVSMAFGDEIHSIPMCGLCGNSGFIKTAWNNPRSARSDDDRDTQIIESFCICPNGRAIRKGNGKAKWGGDEQSSSIVKGRTKK